MITPEDIQQAISERLLEIEQLSEEGAYFYRLGFLECVNFLIELQQLISKSPTNPLENLSLPIKGGIN